MREKGILPPLNSTEYKNINREATDSVVSDRIIVQPKNTFSNAISNATSITSLPTSTAIAAKHTTTPIVTSSPTTAPIHPTTTIITSTHSNSSQSSSSSRQVSSTSSSTSSSPSSTPKSVDIVKEVPSQPTPSVWSQMKSIVSFNQSPKNENVDANVNPIDRLVNQEKEKRDKSNQKENKQL